MPESNIDRKATLLHLSSAGELGVTHLFREAHMGPAVAVRLLREMQEEGLVLFSPVRSRTAGRPTMRVEPTHLGRDFLNNYRRLELTPLKSRKTDRERAAKDALYTKRLVRRGFDPYKLFLEINDLVARPR